MNTIIMAYLCYFLFQRKEVTIELKTLFVSIYIWAKSGSER
jgi:hypothetical protein